MDENFNSFYLSVSKWSSFRMQLRIQGGGQGGHGPPVPIKTSHKKMAAIHGALYFMFLAPAPSDHSGSDAGMFILCYRELLNLWRFLMRLFRR